MALELENVNNLISDDLDRRNRNWVILDDAETQLTSHLAEDATQAHLPENVGLGNVDNVKQASKAEFDGHNNDATRHITSTEQAKLSSMDEGNRTYTEQNYVTNGESITDSIDAIDITLGNAGFGGDMLKSVYDQDGNGIVDNAELVRGFLVQANVPADAKFTDTVYTHPVNHPPNIISQDANNRFVTDTEKATWNGKSNFSGSYNDLTNKPTIPDTSTLMPKSGGVLENYREKLVTLSGTSTSINLNNGNVFAHTLSGDTTYTISNAVSGQAHSFTLIINMGSTVRTLTFPASVKWQGGEMPDMSTANKTYVLTFMTVDGGTNWLGMFGGEF